MPRQDQSVHGLGLGVFKRIVHGLAGRLRVAGFDALPQFVDQCFHGLTVLCARAQLGRIQILARDPAVAEQDDSD